MKSAYELAMERLEKQSPTAKLTEAQKAEITEQESLFKAKKAEKELFLQGEIAKAENIEMSQNHWEVVNFLRDYYNEYQIAPAVRVLTKAIGKQLGPEKGNSQYLYELFPYGPAKQACKIAGLPKPTGCV